MREFHLQAPLSGTRAGTEDFEDERGAVQDLRLQQIFQVTLLDRRQIDIEQDQVRRFRGVGDVRPEGF